MCELCFVSGVSSYSRPPEGEMEEAKAAWEAGELDERRREVERKLEEWKTVPINVAVAGNPAVGKSSFINAVRGLTAEDVELAVAPVGVVQTTIDVKRF